MSDSSKFYCRVLNRTHYPLRTPDIARLFVLCQLNIVLLVVYLNSDKDVTLLKSAFHQTITCISCQLLHPAVME